MKKFLIGAALLLALTACGAGESGGSYTAVDAETAKAMMDEDPEVLVLDVREQDEYDSGHIAGAVLLPVGTIDADTAAAVIPETDAAVLVYCRSGNRSKTASQTLADLGYTAVYEFGGVRDWPYGLVTD